MKIVVFGSTGGVGRAVLDEALASGHDVTAVARDPSALGLRHDRLDVRRADVFDDASVEAAVGGHDAVVSALGVGSSRASTTLYSDGTGAIIRAMRATGVDRMICVSAAGFIIDRHDSLLLRLLVKPLLMRVMREPYADMQRMEQIVRDSDVNWTVIRPAKLTDGEQSGEYRTAVGHNVASGYTISRRDIADCIVRRLEEPTAEGGVVSIAN